VSLGQAIVDWIDNFKAKYQRMPVIVNFHPRSPTARIVFNTFTNQELTRRQILIAHPDDVLEMLVAHPDLTAEQVKELQELLQQQLQPRACFLVAINPSCYRIRQVRVRPKKVTFLGQRQVIPCCEVKESEELVAAFLKDQPQWRSQTRRAPNEETELSAAATVAFARWGVAMEYVDPERAQEFIQNLLDKTKKPPRLEE